MSGVLVVLDVDSTFIENEAIELLAELAGTLDRVADITERAMNGELDFAASLKERVATLAGLAESALAVARDRIRLSPGARELVSTVKAAGGRVGLVSGGFHELIDPIAVELELDYCRANRLEITDGVLSGRVLGEVIDAQAKATALTEWASDFGVPLRNTVAVGDGANDLLMLRDAGLSVGFMPKELVRLAADVVIDSRDLSQVLPLIGLRA